MPAHIAEEALQNRLPSSACRECDKRAVKNGHVICRGNVTLNGQDAAFEYTRRLRAPWRARLLNGQPKERGSVAPITLTGKSAERAIELLSRAS